MVLADEMINNMRSRDQEYKKCQGMCYVHCHGEQFPEL